MSFWKMRLGGMEMKSGRTGVLAHDSYLINLASPNQELYRRSLEAFVIEVQRAEQLGLHHLVMHPGSPGDDNVDAGLVRVAGARKRKAPFSVPTSSTTSPPFTVMDRVVTMASSDRFLRA